MKAIAILMFVAMIAAVSCQYYYGGYRAAYAPAYAAPAYGGYYGGARYGYAAPAYGGYYGGYGRAYLHG